MVNEGDRVKRSLVCLFVAMVVVVAAAAPALAAIEIARINFDPAGRDTGTRSHLNKEVVVIKNTGSRTRSLDGWKLNDKGRDHSYRFSGLSLGAGEYVRLHTGIGDDGAVTGCNGHCFTYYDFYWDLRNYVWNNTGDVATLRNRAGNVVDRCRYGAAASSPKRC